MAYYGKRADSLGGGSGLAGEALIGILLIVLAAVGVFLVTGSRLGVSGENAGSIFTGIVSAPRLREAAQAGSDAEPLRVTSPRSLAESEAETARMRARSMGTARPATGPYCGPGQAPDFGPGLAALRTQVGPSMGMAIECEHHSTADTTEVLQQTDRGLAVYHRDSQLARFTDGFRHWALLPDGSLVEWQGDEVPPEVSPLL